MKTLCLVSIATLALALPAVAQTTGSSTLAGTTAPTGTQSDNANTPGASDLAQRHQRIVQQLRSDLQQSGFTNIRIMPESFLVRAQDRLGHPVMMVVNPDSIEAVTDLGAMNGGGNSRVPGNQAASSNSGTTGSTTGTESGAGTTSNSVATDGTGSSAPNGPGVPHMGGGQAADQSGSTR